MLVEDGRRPGKHEQVVAFSRGDLGGGASVDLVGRDVVDDYARVVTSAPLLGVLAREPLVKSWDEMGPVCDLPCLLAAESAAGKEEGRADAGRHRGTLQEVAARELSSRYW